MNGPRKRLIRGIVMFEVLIALAVFATAFVGIGRVLAGLIDAAGRVEHARYVRGQMESRIALLKKGNIQPLREEQDRDSRGVSYLLEIKKADIRGKKNAPLNGFFLLRVEARWRQGTEEQSDDLETLWFQP
ncbi:MAG: hypothetical protein SFU85_06170 [Candidatus Methylacidiphilales bacterium]|nr:hypothetical protein [Candidatus Methylacidiphilales bacterium]